METKTKEQRHEEYLKKIPEFVLMDDTFMNACFNEQPQLVQTVLRIIMDKPGLIVKSSQIQKVFKNLHGRSVTLDIDAVDENNVEYDIELQQANKGAAPERARFISSIIDANILDPGEDFDKLPETYVIFVTLNDVLKKGQPIYHIRRTIEGSDDVFEDKSHIIYVNSEIQNETPLGRLMHDFHCKNAGDMFNKDLAERVDQLKNTERGNQFMCKIMEDLAREERLENSIEIALNLLKLNDYSIEKIASVTGLSIEKVKELAEELKPKTA